MRKVFIVTLMLVSLASFTSVRADSGAEKATEKEKKQSESLEDYQKLLKSSIFYNDFDDEFGGVYLDDNGNLVVNIVKGKKEKFLERLDVNENTIIKEVDYSLKEITKEMRFIEKLFKEFDIISVARSEELNTLIVTVEGNYEANKKVIKRISKLENIIVVQKENSVSLKDTVKYTINGDSTTINSGGYTIGFAARNSSGDPGFVTAGHGGLTNGKNAYCGIWHCGDVKGHYNDDNVDAAFIKLRDPWIGYTWLPTKTFMNGDSYIGVSAVSSYVVAGTNVYAYGAVSGKESGEILASSVSFEMDGKMFYDFVQADYVAIHGDSGAAVTYWMYAGSATSYRMVMGIQAKSALDDDDNWVPGESYTLFSTVDNIYAELNLLPY